MVKRRTGYTLLPYVGASPVLFGMDAAAIAALLGAPAVVHTNMLGERDESRGGVGIRYSVADSGVVEVAFVPGEVLFFEERNLLEHPDPVAVLSRSDPTPFEFLGFLVFFGLGVTVTGFHDDDPAQRAVTVFRRGRWDDYRPQMTPYPARKTGRVGE